MRLAELDRLELQRRLQCGALCLRTGPFVTRIESRFRAVAEGLATLYADYPLAGANAYVDFSVGLGHGAGIRRWLAPQARFVFDGRPVFEPMPADHAYPLLEWAMNWCVASQAHQYLLLHSAVIERGGLAVILPAPPGSGKSTLCAALIHAGWRLMSDEMALVDRDGSGRVWPLCRSVSLKNRSIDIIRQRIPDAVFNRVTGNTTKGDVTHMKVPVAHVRRMDEPARARWVVFPRWLPDSPCTLVPRSRAGSVVELASNAFNYAQLGEPGFQVLTDLVSGCDCLDFRYTRLDDAVAAFDRLAERCASLTPGDAVGLSRALAA